MSRGKRKVTDFKDSYLNMLAKQGYHIIGQHTAIKPCKWFHESLRGGGLCYKNKFYGIKSHQCIQCTPCAQICTQSCVFCWRTMTNQNTEKGNESHNNDISNTNKISFKWDTPEFIYERLIKEQLNFVQGYKGYDKCPEDRLTEAMHPKLATFSLTGEPTIYPYLNELINEFKNKGMFVFLVTNGSLPDRLEKLNNLPTQLYISMDAPDEQTFISVCRPHVKENAWDNFMRTLGFLNKIKHKTRTVLRMTLVRGHNTNNLEGYAVQINRAEPHYVEVKSFVYVGGARDPDRGLNLSDMLSMEEIRTIAHKLAKLTGYIITDEHVPSRVVLLCRDEQTKQQRFIQ